MFVQHGVSRQYCNTLMKFIRAMLKWGTIRKLVPHQVYWEAKFVPALKKGKTSAYEKPPRQDVSNAVVNRTLPHLLPTIRDMVQIQRLASMRPSEVFRMKFGEIDTEYKTDDGVVIWMYTPGTNKNTWRERKQAGEYFRIIPLGKPEQDVLAPRLVGKSDTDYIFSPKDTVKEHFALRAAKRKSKVQPSQVKRKEKNAKNPKRKDRDCYDRDSYNRAIQRSITAANKLLPENEQIPHWTPYQLRHAAITDIVQQTGKLDIARAVAGQKSISVTQGYNHADVQIAVDQAVKRSR
jgi:integrase